MFTILKNLYQLQSAATDGASVAMIILIVFILIILLEVFQYYWQWLKTSPEESGLTHYCDIENNIVCDVVPQFAALGGLHSLQILLSLFINIIKYNTYLWLLILRCSASMTVLLLVLLIYRQGLLSPVKCADVSVSLSVSGTVFKMVTIRSHWLSSKAAWRDVHVKQCISG